MNTSGDKLHNVLKIIGIGAALLYIAFLFGEGVPLFNSSSFADISVYLLFLIFALGIYFLWRNELIAGIILIAWYILEWILVFWVWIDGGLTLILGLPIAIFGIVLLIIGIRKSKSSK